MNTPPLSTPTPSSKRSGLKLGLLVGLVVLLVLGGWFVSAVYQYIVQLQNGTVDLSEFEQGALSAYSGSTTVASAVSPYVNNINQDPVLGPDNAKLTIIAFEDFECPYSQALQPTLSRVLDDYSDRVQFVYRDFPLSDIHTNAQMAAEAAQCANAQGQFWEYHDLLYAQSNRLSVPDLKAHAQNVGLDLKTFTACLDGREFQEEVKADFTDGQYAGVPGTPSLFFNGNRVSGVLSEDALRQIIDYFLEQ